MLGLPGIVINRLPGAEPGEALYVDVFDGGKVMGAGQAQAFASAMGLPAYSLEMPPLPADKVRGRHCAPGGRPGSPCGHQALRVARPLGHHPAGTTTPPPRHRRCWRACATT